eukprot:gene8702-1560_t
MTALAQMYQRIPNDILAEIQGRQPQSFGFLKMPPHPSDRQRFSEWERTTPTTTTFDQAKATVRRYETLGPTRAGEAAPKQFKDASYARWETRSFPKDMSFERSLERIENANKVEPRVMKFKLSFSDGAHILLARTNVGDPSTLYCIEFHDPNVTTPRRGTASALPFRAHFPCFSADLPAPAVPLLPWRLVLLALTSNQLVLSDLVFLSLPPLTPCMPDPSQPLPSVGWLASASHPCGGFYFPQCSPAAALRRPTCGTRTTTRLVAQRSFDKRTHLARGEAGDEHRRKLKPIVDENGHLVNRRRDMNGDPLTSSFATGNAPDMVGSAGFDFTPVSYTAFALSVHALAPVFALWPSEQLPARVVHPLTPALPGSTAAALACARPVRPRAPWVRHVPAVSVLAIAHPRRCERTPPTEESGL